MNSLHPDTVRDIQRGYLSEDAAVKLAADVRDVYSSAMATKQALLGVNARQPNERHIALAKQYDMDPHFIASDVDNPDYPDALEHNVAFESHVQRAMGGPGVPWDASKWGHPGPSIDWPIPPATANAMPDRSMMERPTRSPSAVGRMLGTAVGGLGGGVVGHRLAGTPGMIGGAALGMAGGALAGGRVGHAFEQPTEPKQASLSMKEIAAGAAISGLTSAGVALAAAGGEKVLSTIVDKATFNRDLKRLREVNPEINKHSEKDIRLVYQSLRMLSPQQAKDPLMGATLLHQTLLNRDQMDAPPRVDTMLAKTLAETSGKLQEKGKELRQNLFQAGMRGVDTGERLVTMSRQMQHDSRNDHILEERHKMDKARHAFDYGALGVTDAKGEAHARAEREKTEHMRNYGDGTKDLGIRGRDDVRAQAQSARQDREHKINYGDYSDLGNPNSEGLVQARDKRDDRAHKINYGDPSNPNSRGLEQAKANLAAKSYGLQSSRRMDEVQDRRELKEQQKILKDNFARNLDNAALAVGMNSKDFAEAVTRAHLMGDLKDLNTLFPHAQHNPPGATDPRVPLSNLLATGASHNSAALAAANLKRP